MLTPTRDGSILMWRAWPLKVDTLTEFPHRWKHQRIVKLIWYLPCHYTLAAPTQRSQVRLVSSGSLKKRLKRTSSDERNKLSLELWYKIGLYGELGLCGELRLLGQLGLWWKLELWGKIRLCGKLGLWGQLELWRKLGLWENIRLCGKRGLWEFFGDGGMDSILGAVLCIKNIFQSGKWEN